MTSPTPPAPAAWRFATVERVVAETFRVKTFTVRLPEWRPFKAGQHYDVRLTAPDGYQAQRSYSIASPPEREGVIDLTIELMEGGEVSPYFHEIVEAGDRIEMRGPIGGPFTWTVDQGGPLLLVGGGSGVVPLMSMARHRALSAPDVPGALLFSSRSFDHIIYREELERPERRRVQGRPHADAGRPKGLGGTYAPHRRRDGARGARRPRRRLAQSLRVRLVAVRRSRRRHAHRNRRLLRRYPHRTVRPIGKLTRPDTGA